VADAEPKVAFGPLALPPALARNLKAAGFVHPMPVQAEAIPLIEKGENVVIHSATGSGKTLAFLVPLLARAFDSPAEVGGGGHLGAVVVAPSQELAVQIAAEAARLLDGPEAVGRSSVLLAISTSREAELEQQDALFSSAVPPRLLVGTPQRLADLCKQPRARPVLRSVRTVVLDEVDLMLPPLPAGSAPRGMQGGQAAGRGRGGRGRGGRGGRGGDGGRGGRGGGRGGDLGRGGGRGGRGGGGGGGPAAAEGYYNPAIQQRLAKVRPAEILLERIGRARARSAPPLQLVSSSATISPDLRRQIALVLGGSGKRDAGTVVTAAPAHPAPRTLKAFGVGGVRLPSTIRHSAYIGKPRALNQMLQLAFEELQPEAPLLVLPNGQSVPRQVETLRRMGFDGAVALQEALGVPASADAGGDGAGGGAGGGGDGGGGGNGAAKRVRPEAGDSLQGAMVRQRSELADAFAARRLSDIPLLVTTEHSARGMDFKGVDCVFLVGLPKRVDSYIHVAGRTAREGRKGRAVTLVTEDDEAERLGAFGQELGVSIEKVDVRFLRGN
jgi:Lhr-like helicase